MTDHAGWQSSQYRGPIRRDPALPPVAYHLGTQHHVMHHVGLVPFEARAWRHPRLDHPILNSNAGCDLPATPPLATLARRFRLTRVLHATGLDPRPAIQTFQLSVLLPKVRDQLLLLGHFAQH